MRRHQSQSPAECFRCPQLSIGFVSVDTPSFVANPSFASPRVSRARTGCCASWAIASRLGIHLGCRGVGRSQMLGETGISPGGHSECVFSWFSELFRGLVSAARRMPKEPFRSRVGGLPEDIRTFLAIICFQKCSSSELCRRVLFGACPMPAEPEARGARLPLTFWAN